MKNSQPNTKTILFPELNLKQPVLYVVPEQAATSFHYRKRTETIRIETGFKCASQTIIMAVKPIPQ